MKTSKLAILLVCISVCVSFSGCGDDSSSKADKTVPVEGLGISSVPNDGDYDELRKQYAELMDYTMFLEKEVVDLRTENQLLTEQIERIENLNIGE